MQEHLVRVLKWHLLRIVAWWIAQSSENGIYYEPVSFARGVVHRNLVPLVRVAGSIEGRVARPCCAEKGDDGRARTHWRITSTADRCQENSFAGNANGEERRWVSIGGGARKGAGVEGEKPEAGTTRHGFSLLRTTGSLLARRRSGRWRDSARGCQGTRFTSYKEAARLREYIFFFGYFFSALADS